MLTEAYRTEYETTNITLKELMEKYDLTYEDIPGYEQWAQHKPTAATKPTKQPPTRARKTKKVDKLISDIISEPVQSLATLATIEEPAITLELLPTKQPLVATEPTETQLDKIAQFKELALDHCINFMNKDAKFSEVKEFKDIVAIVDTLEKSYQKVDPEAGKPTINILINNLMERFNDDC